MKRLTSNKDVSEMGMFELAHNSCYIKDGKARYRDFEKETDARDFIRKIAVNFNIFENGCAELIDDESFDETLLDYLQYGYNTEEGLIALFYRNLWAMAELHDKLKEYEDLDEEGRFPKPPCKIGDTVWNNDLGRPQSYIVTGFSFGDVNDDFWMEEEEEEMLKQVMVYCKNSIGSITGNFAVSEIGKTFFLTKEEAEQALKGQEGVEK